MSKQTDAAANLRRELVSKLAAVKGTPIGIGCSSGVDSHSIVWSALATRPPRTIILYSWRLADRESRDFKSARELASKTGCQFLPIVLPLSKEVLMADLAKLGCTIKTQFECIWPFLYAYPQLCKLGIKTVVSGEFADDRTGLNREAIIRYRNSDEAVSDLAEVQMLMTQRQTEYERKLGRIFGIELRTPYFDESIAAVVRGLTYKELHKPKQKMLTRLAFPQLADLPEHQSLQKGDSGIAKHFECLLDSPWAVPGKKTVVAIYNQLARQYGKASTSSQ